MFRKNTAGQFIHFQGVDSSTGGIKSGVSWTVRRCIDGTFAAATGTVTEDGTTGWYKFAMSQADTNGNNIAFNFTGTGAVPQTVNIVTTACDPTSTAFGLSLAKTTNITGFNDLSTAQVNAEADTALTDYDPPTRTELTTDTNSILSKLLKYIQLLTRKDAAIATDNATEVTAINADGGSGAGSFSNTTDAQEAIRDRGDVAWITATGFSTLDAAGVRSAVGLTSANLDTQLSDIPTNAELSAAVANVSVDEIQATAIADLFNTDSLTTYASAVAGSAVKEIADNAGGSGLTEAGIADAVWDEVLSGHLTAGSTGNALNAAGSAGDPWATTIPGAYGAGTAGKILGDNINATISSRASQASVDTVDTNVDAILIDTAEIGTAGAGLTEAGGTGDHLTAINLPDQTMNITGNLTGNVSGSVGSVTSGVTISGSKTTLDALQDLSSAQVNAEVVDVLRVDALSELSQAAPSATPTFAQALMLLYMSLRNEGTTTATTLTISNDAGTVICKATLSDDGTTFTKTELVTGP